MGFQQELFEVDLERGDTLKSGTGNGGTQQKAEQAISLSLVLLTAANVIVRPDASWGKLLAGLSFILALGGSIALARNTPRTPHTRKVLLVLLTCWLVYGIRLVLLETDPNGSHKHRIQFGIPTRHHHNPQKLADPQAKGTTHSHSNNANSVNIVHSVNAVPHTERIIQSPGPAPTLGVDSHTEEVEEPVLTVEDQHVAVIGDSSDV